MLGFWEDGDDGVLAGVSDWIVYRDGVSVDRKKQQRQLSTWVTKSLERPKGCRGRLTASLEASKALAANSTAAPPLVAFISVSSPFTASPLMSKMETLSEGPNFDCKFLAIWYPCHQPC